ncbi:acetoacetate--CoA ligase [Sphingobium sp. MI1205]|uniref:acetoacetate--CoA ligase n=1 Tax=Sphingobium sp. MI1205 TaxID=407020 RepID=UPI001F1F4E39|nr:acetoacetate--CoA ligase [Sphingobium sp. MI1205]
MQHLMRYLERQKGLKFDGYEALWRWSVDDPAAFWAALWDYFEILSDEPYDAVMSGPDMISTRWFAGAKINYAEHVLRYEVEAKPDEVALHHSSEIRPYSVTSWTELGDAVRALATQLRAYGIEPGDRVGSYMPNVPETAIAMLAVTAIGAIWSSAAPEFGVKTVVDRFAQIEPKLLFAADGYSFAGRKFDRRTEIAEIAGQLPSLERIVWLPYLGQDVPDDIGIETLLWEEMIAKQGPARGDFRFERVACDHPLWVLFSSGTTGLPKAIVHSHVGMVLDQSKQMRLHFDLKPGQSMFFYTTTGWMMWNAVMSALLAGAAAILYDGSPTWPNLNKLWEIAEQSGATTFGASPTLVKMMDDAKMRPAEDHDLSRLDKIVLGGAPSTPATFEWLYANVKPDMWIINTSGGTDLCGGLLGSVPSRAVRAAEMQGRLLGIAVEAWDDAGKPLVGQVGELVVTKPFPSQPLFFWGDEGNARYYDTYFSTYPNIWRHGDFVKITSDGGCYVYGRADATLNRFGVRIGTSEIYGALVGIDCIVDSVIICCETADGGFFMPLFVELHDGDTLDEPLIDDIKRRLKEQASPRHVPDVVLQVPKVPYTLTGKKMEVPLRKLLMGAPIGKVATADAMADPRALDWYAAFADRPEIRARFLQSQTESAA